MRYIIYLLILFSPVTFSDEVGIVKKDSVNLMSSPNNGEVIDVLGKDIKVIIKDRKGLWLQIDIKEKLGWVKINQVRKESASSTSRVNLAMLSTVSSGSQKAGKVGGVRGLTPDKLKSAGYDEKQVELLESFGISPSSAQNFANNESLEKLVMAETE